MRMNSSQLVTMQTSQLSPEEELEIHQLQVAPHYTRIENSPKNSITSLNLPIQIGFQLEREESREDLIL